MGGFKGAEAYFIKAPLYRRVCVCVVGGCVIGA